MITHIVMIKFKNSTSKDKIIEIKEDIQNLKDKIKELNYIEVGINFANEDRAMDLVLTAKFDSKEDLNIYATDESHKNVINKIKEVADYTKVVDYINE